MNSKIFVLVIGILSLASCGGGGGGGGGGSCGGAGNTACPEGQFCKYEDLACGAIETTGSCQEIPLLCDTTVSEVCTCDGLTFDNECLAEQAGQSVAAAGQCA